MQLLEQQVQHSKDMHQLLLDDMSRLLTRHDHMLVGYDGNTGLVAEINQIKQDRVGERIKALEVTNKSLELTIARWGGAISIATVTIPVLLKVFWP